MIRNLEEKKFGVSIEEGKYLTPFRTQKLSPPSAKVVHGRLCVRIARCTFLKATLAGGFFILCFYFVLMTVVNFLTFEKIASD